MAREVFYTHSAELDSSALAWVRYDDIDWTLYVAFHNGTIAGYSEVPQGVYEMLVDAPSAGRYYNASIIGKFDGTPTDDIEFIDRNAVEAIKETVVQDDGVITFTGSANLAGAAVLDGIDWNAPRVYDQGGFLPGGVRTFEDDLNAMAPAAREFQDETVGFSGEITLDEDDKAAFTYVVEFDSQVVVESDVELDTAGVLKAVVEQTGGAKVLSITRVFS